MDLVGIVGECREILQSVLQTNSAGLAEERGNLQEFVREPFAADADRDGSISQGLMSNGKVFRSLPTQVNCSSLSGASAPLASFCSIPQLVEFRHGGRNQPL
jgi:hypothetical protein